MRNNFYWRFIKSIQKFNFINILASPDYIHHHTPLVIRNIICLLILIVTLNVVYADDPGITKVRLKQLNDTSYILEADVPQILLSTLKTPILPDRFRFIEFSYDDKSGWITQRATITTTGPPLSPDDEFLLPWNRNGVAFTAQWIDGTIHKKLFYRSLDGIHIPMKSGP